MPLRLADPPPAPEPGPQPYRVRQLPVAEWERLRPLPFAANGLPDPNTALILVGETAAGEIVGIWALLLQPMLDGLWIHPDHRGTTIASRLAKAMNTLLTEYEVPHAFT